MAKKKVEGGTEAEVQGTEAPKKAYEGGEVVYWLQGEVSNDDSTLIRNAKRVFNEQTIPHVKNDPSAVANIKYAMMTGAPAAPQREEVNPAAGAGAEGVPGAAEAGGRFIPPVATPTAQGNEGERAANPERAPSGQTGKPETTESGNPKPPQ